MSHFVNILKGIQTELSTVSGREPKIPYKITKNEFTKRSHFHKFQLNSRSNQRKMAHLSHIPTKTITTYPIFNARTSKSLNSHFFFKKILLNTKIRPPSELLTFIHKASSAIQWR